MQTTQRINELDIIRGVALLGILMVNMGLFAFPALYQNPLEYWPRRVDQITVLAINFVGEGKFISMFSFLFGLGFTIFIQNAQKKQGSAVGLFTRRLLVLSGIGIIHSFFIWYGDVLCIYSLGGFLLLLLRNWQPKYLLMLAFGLLLLPVVFMLAAGLIPGSDYLAGRDDAGLDNAVMAKQAITVYQTGTIGDLFSQNNFDQVVTKIGYLMIFPQVLAMFLFGTYAGKKQFFRQVPHYLPLIKQICLISLVIGLPVAVISLAFINASPESLGYEIVQMVSSYIGGSAMGIFYITLLVILLQKASWQVILHPFGAVGRMAATNYILQSLLSICIFYSFGLGMYAKTSPAWGVVISMTIFSFQLFLSNWWMGRFTYGPLEWVWRMLTYGKKPAIGKTGQD